MRRYAWTSSYILIFTLCTSYRLVLAGAANAFKFFNYCRNQQPVCWIPSVYCWCKFCAYLSSLPITIRETRPSCAKSSSLTVALLFALFLFVRFPTVYGMTFCGMYVLVGVFHTKYLVCCFNLLALSASTSMLPAYCTGSIILRQYRAVLYLLCRVISYDKRHNGMIDVECHDRRVPTLLIGQTTPILPPRNTISN